MEDDYYDNDSDTTIMDLSVICDKLDDRGKKMRAF